MSLPESYAEETPEGARVIIPIAAAGLAILTAAYVKTPFDDEFETVGRLEGVGSDLLRALAKHESNFNPEAVSPANSNGTRDYGLMQINGETARRMGFDPLRLVTSKVHPDRGVVMQNMTIAARLLKAVQRELGDQQNSYTTIAAYNAGSPAIRRRGIFNMSYVQSVVLNLQMYQLASIIRKKGGNTA